MTTTSISRITKSKCAPKIWKKYNANQKRLWILFYSEFIEEMNYPSELWGNSSRKQREIIAHNLACGAVRELTSEERTSCAKKPPQNTMETGQNIGQQRQYAIPLDIKE
jgi:hypothetical protein